MLAPDVAATEGQLQQQVAAAQVVSQYCQAVVTLVPAYAAAITDPTLTQTLTTVETDAQTWPSSLCSAYTQQVPSLFVTFGGTFAAAAAALSEDAQTLLANPAEPGARGDLLQRLQSLLTSLQGLGQTATGLQSQLVAFDETVQHDHTAIVDAQSRLAASLPNGGTIVEAVQSSLGLSFFSAQQLSPCVAIVQIDSDVSLKIVEVSQSAPEVVPVVLAQALLTALQQQNEQAIAALSAILETWQALIAKYQAVIQQLTQAEESQLGSVVQQLDIQTAAVDWSQLAQFAAQLTSNG